MYRIDPLVTSALVEHFYGIYHAVVVNNSDPLLQERVKLHIPQVLGTAVSNWAQPVSTNIIPQIGQKVFAMFVGGDRTKPVYFLVEPPPAAGAPTVVQLFGAIGTFGGTTFWTTSPSGHSFVATPVANWLFGPGEASFYSEVMSDGQIVMSTVAFSENELIPTYDHAELNIFDPLRNKFYNVTIPTSTNVTKAVAAGKTTGGTDAGGGDLRRIVSGSTELLMFTCGGYYFNWDIGADGLYPVLGILSRNSNGDWLYNQGLSLTTNQLEATNPTVWQANITPTINTGVNGQYWYARVAGQMAVLPQSGNIVVGHYFNLGSHPNTGCISVVSPSGQLLASYQIPDITPPVGTLSTGAVRDVEADPSSVLNDERFVILYDGFGSNLTQQHPFQEFSYNASTKTITPMSVPCSTTDTGTNIGFSIIDNQGTLFITTNIGLGAGNTSAYVKNAGTGNRSYVTNFPASPGWQTGPNSWGAKAEPDYSIGTPAQYFLGIFDGPLTVDPVTGTILHPGASGRVGFVIPQYPLAFGPNLLSTADSGFETTNLLSTDDSIFANTVGSWTPFLAAISRVTNPPVAPPFGTNALQMSEAFGFLIINTTGYTVIPNHVYQVQINFLAGSTARQCSAYFQWHDSHGTVISTSAATNITNNSSTWTACNVTATAPSNAATAVIFVQVNTSTPGELHYIAANSLWDMTLPDWAGFLNVVQRAQGIAHTGNFSMALSAQFNNEFVSGLGPFLPVVPGQEYKASAWFLASTAVSNTCEIFIRFFNASNVEIVQIGTTLKVSDNTSTWTQARTGGLAPAGAVNAQVVIEVSTQTAGETHYVDDVILQTQPFTSTNAVDVGLTQLRSTYPNMGLGRGCISNRRYYIPIANTSMTAAENTALNNGTYIPAPKPQFLVAIDLAKVLSR